MTNEIKRVGFVGLGRVASPIAANILKAGFAVTVWNRTSSKTQPLLERGARLAGSGCEAAAGADAVITCLLDDKSVLDQVVGPDGVLRGLEPERIHIGTTTVSPGCSARLAELHKAHRSHYLAGPVVGRPDAAAAGQLATYVAGDAGVLARCRPLLEAYTKTQTYVGASPGVANSVKLLINSMILSKIELMGQLYAFAKRVELICSWPAR